MAQMVVIPTSQLLKWLDGYRYKQLHIHHTWIPAHAQFNGSNHIDMMKAMRDFHVNTNGWDDIAQQVSIFPDGKWCTGRAFDSTPASIKGWNTGAFCVEMIGNFDTKGGSVKMSDGRLLKAQPNPQGYNSLEGVQLDSILDLTAYFIKRLGEDAVKFHRDHPDVTKTCPGTSIDKDWFVGEAKKRINGRSVTTMSQPVTFKSKEWFDAKGQKELLVTTLDDWYRKGLINDYRWVEAAANGDLTDSELGLLNSVVNNRLAKDMPKVR